MKLKESVRSKIAIGVAVLLTIGTGAMLITTDTTVAHKNYYVHCGRGLDTNDGLSRDTPWKTITRANKALLQPGDTLQLRQGCTFTGVHLIAKWVGTAADPITIKSFGNGEAKPIIFNASLVANGKYEVIDGLVVDFPVQKLSTPINGCAQPLGQYYAMNVTDGGSNITIQNSEAHHATAGLHIAITAGPGNKILHNTFSNNNVMQEPFNGRGNLGAWGMLINGSNNEIAYNHFQDNSAMCTTAVDYASNSVEIYRGDNNVIHHNTMLNDRVFSELGSSATDKSSNNYFAYNAMTSNKARARFITTRGSGDTQFGPVNTTVVERNTVNFTGALSEGLICSLSCNSTILTARYNIINVVYKNIFFDKSMGQKNNILWAQGQPVHIQDGANGNHVVASGTVTPEYIVGDPKFVSASNVHLQPVGPAINRGGATVQFTTDLDNVAVTGVPEAGAYEFRS